MKVAIHDCEKESMKHKTFPNFALMKISAYHKAQGDSVEWFDPAHIYDRVYSSSVFDFTKKSAELPPDTIKGGTGYGLYNELPPEIDNCFPDYSIYSECDYAIGFLTRGCVNKCSFCIVPKKEGGIRPYAKWQNLVRPDTKKIHLMDNNILACPYGIEQLRELSKTDYILDVNQGLDIMLLTEEIVQILSKIKWERFIRFSCDKEYQLPYFERMVELFDKYHISKSRVFIYLLCQKDIANAERRVQKLHALCKSFNIYAQAEKNSLLGIMPNKMQNQFANRYIYGRNYKHETWLEFCKRNHFTES